MAMLGPSAFKARKRNAPRPEWKVADAYLKWLRGRPCFLADSRQGGCGLGDPPRRAPVEAAHINADQGMGTKSSDFHALPLCQRHHDEQHGKIGGFSSRGGWPTFQLKYGFNAKDVAAEYWRRWPGRVKWEAENGS